ncbi:MAG: hypothetical protein ABI369_14070 [Acetobacteraceae bacterium]
MTTHIESVGVILVHGIGEQRRFEFLDGQVRSLVAALRARPDVQRVNHGGRSVDINPGSGAPFVAEHDTWTTGPDPTVTIVVHRRLNGEDRETRLQIHEVWWADVNEPYSLAKQFRFWLWGLAVWAHPFRGDGNLPTSSEVYPPRVPDSASVAARYWARFRLFLTGVVFTQVGLSVGFLVFLASRLFNWRVPDILRTLSNYISAVKLYNQTVRFGPGLFWNRLDFLDSIGMPPRVSIRRRMIRAIADVASNDDHERWYILAHSLGSIPAFNGLMETGYAWPAYLDETRWQRLKRKHLAGPPAPNWVHEDEDTFPERPAWVHGDELVYRRRVFKKFRGFLTYGSPLEKFASIWPLLVPISQVPAFGSDVVWINVLNPTDPVAGQLKAFISQPTDCCPRPVNVAYSTSRVLLLSHLKYLTYSGEDGLAARTVDWLITGMNDRLTLGASLPPPTPGTGIEWNSRWLEIGGGRFKAQIVLAYVTWGLVLWLTACIAGFVLPITVDAASAAYRAGAGEVSQLWSGSRTPGAAALARGAPPIVTSSTPVGPPVRSGWWHSFRDLKPRYRGLIVLIAGFAATFLVGGVGHIAFRMRLAGSHFGYRKDFPNREFEVQPSPDP